MEEPVVKKPEFTMVRVKKSTAAMLTARKQPKESYDELIVRLVLEVDNKPVELREMPEEIVDG